MDEWLQGACDYSEVVVTERDRGRIAYDEGYGSHGEPVRRVRDAGDAVTEVWLASTKLLPEAAVAVEVEERYGMRSAGM